MGFAVLYIWLISLLSDSCPEGAGAVCSLFRCAAQVALQSPPAVAGEGQHAGVEVVSSNNMNASVFHQAVVQMEGNNKLVTEVKGMKSVTELNGDTITYVSVEGQWLEQRAAFRSLPWGATEALAGAGAQHMLAHRLCSQELKAVSQ